MDSSTPRAVDTPFGNERFSQKVIVVGAGPVGLMTAVRLAQAGIRVDVIEKEKELSKRPRAAGYHAGALLALQRTLIFAEAKRLGFTGNGLCWRKPLVDDGNGGRKMGDIIARLPFPSNEDTKDETAIGTGLVNVYFNTEISDLHQEADSVIAIVKTIDDKFQTFQGAFLVGADGGKSKTRKLLDIKFKGHSWPERIVATDFLLEDKYLDNVFPTSMVIHPMNFGLVTPLQPVKPGEKSLYRCSIAVDPDDTRSDEDLTSESHLNYLLEFMVPGPRPLDVEIVNSTAYRTHQLCAATMRRGRCLLAGDAAHLNNPWGALGLTTGLLDAEALANSLELIMNEGKPIYILDIYSDERTRVFQTFVDPVSTQNKLRVTNDPETATENWLLRAMVNPSHEQLAE